MRKSSLSRLVPVFVVSAALVMVPAPAAQAFVECPDWLCGGPAVKCVTETPDTQVRFDWIAPADHYVPYGHGSTHVTCDGKVAIHGEVKTDPDGAGTSGTGNDSCYDCRSLWITTTDGSGPDAKGTPVRAGVRVCFSSSGYAVSGSGSPVSTSEAFSACGDAGQ